jgi:dUTP pyrophosphatase
MNPKLKICNKSPHENPTYAKPGDSGMDLRAWIYWEDNSGFYENPNLTPGVYTPNLTPESNVPYIKDVCIPCCTIEEVKNDDGTSSFVKNSAKLGVKLAPMARVLIHTGIYLEIPEGYEVQVRPKSGQALKKGITVLNTPGTVDSRYTGEICVIVINLSNECVTIEDGEKIAQMVLCPVCHEGLVDVEIVDEISTNTERGDGGFGHTGIN